ncbi:protein kinase [Actinoplanes sp. NPDC049265]|uniref:serine/threonine-protein kinase n=1 Tax=Actinoplanes sp. NPDC049265 TaxID=3363902 RepID=UPI003716E3FE
MTEGNAARVIAGRYRLDKILGRGGMGAVWQGRDTLLDRDVAIKELYLPGAGDAPVDSDDPRVRRAMREAQAAARLRHPGVVAVHDVAVDDGRPWIVMELVDGPSLADVIATGGALTPARTAEIGLQVLDALVAAHQRGTVHRDVKPANILIETGRAMLTDFGIAAVDDASALTMTGQMIGSPAFMAPERINGVPAAPPADLWALGVTLYTAVTGRSPFQREDTQATIAAILTSPPAPTPDIGPLWQVIAGLLEKDPGRRSTAARAREQLTLAAAHQPAFTPPPISPPPAPPAYQTPPPADQPPPPPYAAPVSSLPPPYAPPVSSLPPPYAAPVSSSPPPYAPPVSSSPPAYAAPSLPPSYQTPPAHQAPIPSMPVPSMPPGPRPGFLPSDFPVQLVELTVGDRVGYTLRAYVPESDGWATPVFAGTAGRLPLMPRPEMAAGYALSTPEHDLTRIPHWHWLRDAMTRAYLPLLDPNRYDLGLPAVNLELEPERWLPDLMVKANTIANELVLALDIEDAYRILEPGTALDHLDDLLRTAGDRPRRNHIRQWQQLDRRMLAAWWQHAADIIDTRLDWH